ncbi:hypothetical protein ACHAXS_000724 [Conticribra weissflogii]
MILNVHSDTAYLIAPRARSRASGHLFLGWVPENGKPIRLNGTIFNLCELLKFVAGSAAEAELGALFLCGQKVRIFRCILEELGHPQPPTPIHCSPRLTYEISCQINLAMVPKTLAQDANACVALAAADTGIPCGTLLFGTASGESHLGVPTHPLRVLGVGA